MKKEKIKMGCFLISRPFKLVTQLRLFPPGRFPFDRRRTMGASLSQLELVKDIRSQGAVNGQDVYNSLMSKSLPTVSDLAIGDKVELFKHVRQAFQDKLSEITARPSNGGRGTPPVRETDIDDLLYAQIEIDQLIDDFRKVQDTGPLSVADLTKGVEHMFSKYDTDGKPNPFHSKT